MKFILLLNLVFSTVAFAMPAQVILFRHAEKPYPVEGAHLSEQGYARARSWAPFFERDPESIRFGKIVALYAMKPKDQEGSVRAIETLEPTAQLLNLPIHSNFFRDEINSLVREIFTEPAYDRGTVLICWEHKVIPEIAHALGAKSAPERWDGSVYDQVWFLNMSSGTGVEFDSRRTDSTLRSGF
jgi:broad specificity phosphatase PhoE